MMLAVVRFSLLFAGIWCLASAANGMQPSLLYSACGGLATGIYVGLGTRV